MIEENIMAEGSNCDVSQEAVQRGHPVDISTKALFVPAVPAAVHQGKAHAQIDAHHLYELEGQEVCVMAGSGKCLLSCLDYKCHYMP